MAADERIRTAFRRSRKALAARPAFGQGTATTRLRLTDGLRCEVEDGRWRLEADLSEKGGGEGAAPDPGVFGRSALATCLAMAYKQWAVHLEVPLEALEVDVEADYDTRGQYGVGDVSPGYAAVRYVVRFETTADEGDVARLNDAVEAHCPWLDDFRRPLAVSGRVETRRPGGGAR